MEKIVSQLDAQGYFDGAVVADESPLEPGVFHIPAGAIDVTPPSLIDAGKRYKIVGGKWKAEAIQQPQPEPVPEPEPLTPDQIKALKIWAVQRHMDLAAQALNYDSIATAISYADEPSVPKFQAEGQAFRAWRSLVWARCHEIMAEVETGERETPSDEELIASLPTLKLPEEA